jgi:hypothetical protein
MARSMKKMALVRVKKAEKEVDRRSFDSDARHFGGSLLRMTI